DAAARTATFNAVGGEIYYIRVTASPLAAAGADTGSFAFSVLPQPLEGDSLSPDSPSPARAEGPPAPPPDAAPAGFGAATNGFSAPATEWFAADLESATVFLQSLFISDQNRGVIASPGARLPDQGITGDADSLFADDPVPRSGHDPSGAWYGLSLEPT